MKMEAGTGLTGPHLAVPNLSSPKKKKKCKVTTDLLTFFKRCAKFKSSNRGSGKKTKKKSANLSDRLTAPANCGPEWCGSRFRRLPEPKKKKIGTRASASEIEAAAMLLPSGIQIGDLWEGDCWQTHSE